MKKRTILASILAIILIIVAGCNVKPGQGLSSSNAEQTNLAGQATATEVTNCNADSACSTVYKKCLNEQCTGLKSRYDYYTLKIKKRPVSKSDFSSYTKFKNDFKQCDNDCYDSALAATIYYIAPGPAPITLKCGDTITSDTILASDITCGKLGPGLSFAADNVVLDCNGHGIAGPQNLQYTPGLSDDAAKAEAKAIAGTVGINIDSHKGVTLKNCNIEGFYSGISLQYADNAKILNNVVNQAQVSGLRIWVTNTAEVSGNTFMGASGKEYLQGNGVWIGNSVDIALKNNIIKDNPHVGIIIGTISGSVTGNTIQNNGGKGLQLAGTSTLAINNNNLCNNKEGDLYFAPGSYPLSKGVLSGTGNKLQNIVASPTALYGVGVQKDFKTIQELLNIVGWPMKGKDYTLCNPSAISTP